jgi:hypothetical protein
MKTKTLIKKEIKALQIIQASNFPESGNYAGYIGVSRFRREGQSGVSVYIDRYQMVRDYYNLPDAPASFAVPGWDVDEWEECKQVVFQGGLSSAKTFRRAILAAKKLESIFRETLEHNHYGVLTLLRGLESFRGNYQ